MTLKELKSFIARLPIEMDSYNIVNGEVGYIDGDDDNVVYRIDKPIVSLYVDEGENEICFFHQSREDINDFENGDIENGDSEKTK